MRWWGVVGLVLVLGACGSSGEPSAQPAPDPSPSSVGSPSASPTPTGKPAAARAEAPEDLLARAERLLGVRVTRRGSTYDVTAAWGTSCGRNGCRPVVLARSSDGFETVDARVTPYSRALRTVVPAHPEGAPDRDRCPREEMLADPVVSLHPGVTACVMGGDGATLFPFQRVVDLRTGRRHEVSWPHDEMAYTTGQVVLPDGRFLVLLNDWSDDSADGPGDRHHGLWVSEGSDWSRYRPWQPSFTPRLDTPPAGTPGVKTLSASVEPDGVLWLETWDDRAYVSADDGTSFREIATR